MTKLHLSPDLVLPLEAATRRLAILAMSGAGKSNVAVVLAEQMFAAGIPWVAIDPKGDWWGVRSSKDGKGPGLPIAILGGLHGDVPLEPTSGKMIADMIVEQRLTCVLDISEFEDRQKQWGFLIDLGETLLRKNRQVLHLFLEEADEYLPQRTTDRGNLLKCLGVWMRVVKRGRFRGIGSTQITQRNASLNKDTLYQAEALIAMRAAGKADRDAVKGWVEHHSSSAEIVSSLPTLADGEAWVSSPAWLKLTKRVQFNRRHTFDSGSTPVLLKGKTAPATLADIDLDKLRTRMAASIEKAKADDPVELRRTIATKDREIVALKKQVGTAKPVVDEGAVAKAVDRARTEWARGLKRLVGKDLARLSGAIDTLKPLAGRLDSMLADVVTAYLALDGTLSPNGELAPAVFTSAIPAVPTVRSLDEATRFVRTPPGVLKAAEGVAEEVFPPAVHVDGSLAPGAQKLLNAAAKLASVNITSPTRGQVAAIAGVSPTSSTTDKHFGFLVKNGFFAGDGAGGVQLTASGKAAAALVESPPSLEEYVAEWQQLLGSSSERKLYDAMVGRAPPNPSLSTPIRRAALAELAGISSTSSTTDAAFSRLIGLDLLVKAADGEVKPGRAMFPEGLV
jgi:hypothetical protein